MRTRSIPAAASLAAFATLTLTTLTLSALLHAPITQAADAGIPSFDFEALMENVEFELNEMQVSITLEESADAIERARKIEQAFKQIEDFFAGWGYADDAVLSAQQYQQRSQKVVELLNAKDFTQAYDLSVEFSDHCKACHDNYKPLP